MSHMDYDTLVGSKDTEGSLRNFLNRDNTPSAQLLHEAEQWIYQRLRAREMIAYATGTYQNSDNGVIALPTLYRAPIFLHFTGVERHFPKYKLLDFVRSKFSYDADGNRITGTPTIWATDGTNIVFDVFAPTTTTYNYEFAHYAELAALSSTNATNFLTSRYPRLLRMVLMAFAHEFHEDDTRATLYYAKAEAEIRAAEVEKDLELAAIEIEMNIDGAGDGVPGYGNL